jgi:hypothetical protein
MGHVELAQNNFKEAVIYYGKAIALDNGNVDNILLLIDEDKDILLSSGIEESFFPLLYDQLRYSYN